MEEDAFLCLSASRVPLKQSCWRPHARRTPAPRPTHTWKDFFIHVATIVVGLLIAIGLEQTVEAIHHRRQLHELRNALQQDNGKALRDDVDIEASARNEITWLTARIDDLTAALDNNTTPHFIP